MQQDLIARAFEALQTAEGYVNAAAWRETSEPPYELGKACRDVAMVRNVLADLQRYLTQQLEEKT